MTIVNAVSIVAIILNSALAVLLLDLLAHDHRKDRP